MADGGYDVSDYTDIDPLFGTLQDARALLDEAHALGLRVIVDFVANHTSDAHPWFRQALASPPGSPWATPHAAPMDSSAASAAPAGTSMPARSMLDR